MNIKNWFYMGMGGAITMALAAGAFVMVNNVSADEGIVDAAVTFAQFDDVNQRGPRGGNGMRGGDQTALAEALGVTVEDLDAAKEAAKAAKLDAAVDAGLITEEEATDIANGEARFPRGVFADAEFEFDKDTAFADALGVTVEELEEAKMEVKEGRLAELVEEGVLTQEEADAILAGEEVEGFGRGNRGPRGNGPRGNGGGAPADVDGAEA